MHIIMSFAKLMHVLMIAPPLSSECEEIIMTKKKFVNLNVEIFAPKNFSHGSSFFGRVASARSRMYS